MGPEMFDPAFLQLIGQFGLPIALVVYFVWRADKRETRLANRLDGEQDKLRQVYESIINKQELVIDRNSTAIIENTEESRKHRQGLDQMLAAISAIECRRPWDGKDRRMGFGSQDPQAANGG